MQKGGVKIKGTILFGKYQICHMIGSGRTGTVWLAMHLGLSEYRAIKRVAKAHNQYERFKREAFMLKRMRHPGIPIIYDLEEDSRYCYLIEEYLEGESLYSLISRQGSLKEEAVIRYGIQICQLVEYLHFAGQEPILYLDLQPNNLLVCNGIIKLIDFDQAIFAKDACCLKQRFGTVGCAAPEQFHLCETLDERTDLYAIGAVLHYMRNGAFAQGQPGYHSERGRHCNVGLTRVIRRLMEPDKDQRYRSAAQAAEELIRLSQEPYMNNQKAAMSSLSIALAGSRPGTGTTHLAIGLSSYLIHQGISNIFEEVNGSGTVMKLCRFYGARPDGLGLFRIRGCTFRPCYGTAVSLPHPTGTLMVRDYGTDWRTAIQSCEPVSFILTAGGSPWEIDELYEALENCKGSETLHLVFRQLSEPVRNGLPDWLNKSRIYRAPVFEDPFRTDRACSSFYSALFRDMERTFRLREDKIKKGGETLKNRLGVFKQLRTSFGRGPNAR